MTSLVRHVGAFVAAWLGTVGSVALFFAILFGVLWFLGLQAQGVGRFVLLCVAVAAALMILSAWLARRFPVPKPLSMIYSVVALMTFTPMFWLYDPVMRALQLS